MTRSGKCAMRLLSLVLCLVSVFALAQPALAASGETEIDAQTQTYTTAVHNYASFSSTVIGRMEDGTTVTILDTTKHFFKIDCYDTVGYVAKGQVSTRLDGSCYIKCDPKSAETEVMTYQTLGQAITLRSTMLNLAERYQGVPYVYGGMSPWGFDCSGFTKYVYREIGFDLTRRASTQLGDGIIVSKENLQVGDLIFLRYPGEPCEASHVGFYVGDGMVVHASSSRGISYAALDGYFFATNFLCARRVINTAAATAPEAVPVSSAATGLCRMAGMRSID